MQYLILGAGISGKSLARFLQKEGRPFFFYDDKKEPQKNLFLSLKESKTLLEKNDTTLLLSPGVPLSHPLILLAQSLGRPVLSELDFSLKKKKAPIIAVTGTNGKSTVVSMIYHVLKELGYKTALLGNIGTPASSILAEEKKYDFIVLEISSYQLEQLEENNFFRSVFLNFSEDHLERHKTLKNYFLAKYKIFQTKNKEGCGFCEESVIKLAESFGKTPKNLSIPLETFQLADFEKIVPKKLHSPKHNLKNACYALQLCASVCNEKHEALGKTLENFKTIPHRFEYFAKRKEVVFIDDSKATNMNATLSALSSLEQKTLLLLGGLTKGGSFKEILLFKEKIHRILSFGAASATIEKELNTDIPVQAFSSLKELVPKLCSILDQESSIQCVLLSPACSSFDEFQNFSERGDYFQKKVLLLLAEEAKTNGSQKDKTKKSLL